MSRRKVKRMHNKKIAYKPLPYFGGWYNIVDGLVVAFNLTSNNRVHHDWRDVDSNPFLTHYRVFVEMPDSLIREAHIQDYRDRYDANKLKVKNRYPDIVLRHIYRKLGVTYVPWLVSANLITHKSFMDLRNAVSRQFGHYIVIDLYQNLDSILREWVNATYRETDIDIYMRLAMNNHQGELDLLRRLVHFILTSIQKKGNQHEDRRS